MTYTHEKWMMCEGIGDIPLVPTWSHNIPLYSIRYRLNKDRWKVWRTHATIRVFLGKQLGVSQAKKQ